MLTLGEQGGTKAREPPAARGWICSATAPERSPWW